MILAAVSHFADGRDCFCMEPDRFRFRLHCAKGDIARIILHYQDKYLPLTLQDTRVAVPMHLACSDNEMDCWETEICFHVVCLRYWFELVDQTGQTMYYSNYHFSQLPLTDTDDMFDCPQNMREEERFVIPSWAENKVLYQVFPSRFASSQPISEEQWYKAPIGFQDDLHGNLQGIIHRLNHIHDLGADILYMTPIFRANSCHKYDTIDYYTVDPSFGTKEDLKALVDRAHAMGMQVILDGVFNHTSPDFFAFADVRKNREKSRYLDWYYIDSFPLHANWGEKPNYKTFSYFGGMPKLNLYNPEVSRYIMDVALYWLRECHIDGWRLDVGDEIIHGFWKAFRQEVKAEFPDALIIGEVWHYAPDFLQGDEWDTVMNYPFYQSVLRLVAEQRISVSQFAGEINFLRSRLHPKVYPLLWNLVGSHDTPRLLNQCGGDRGRMKLIAALQLLSPGMPMIYYGDEFGMEGAQDPDCRRGMLWDPNRQDTDMYGWYRQLLAIRKALPEILDTFEETTDDERGLLIRRTESHAVIFHCGSGAVPIPDFTGKVDLLTGVCCSGTIGPFSAAVY